MLNRWLLAVISAAILSSLQTAVCFTSPHHVTTATANPNNHHHHQVIINGVVFPSQVVKKTMQLQFSSTTQSSTETTTNTSSISSISNDQIFDATQTLLNYDQSQQSFIQTDGSQGMGGGLSALHYIQSLDSNKRLELQSSIKILIHVAHSERAINSAKGRIMLGFCSSNAPEALAGLKSWVTNLDLPRGMLHGMDVDGVPIPVEELGSVYVKYSTGGAMTFSDMRKSGKGFDALWRPGDALLETYDGDFRGVYLNVELSDGVFRQFGVLPTDLFMEEEEW